MIRAVARAPIGVRYAFVFYLDCRLESVHVVCGANRRAEIVWHRSSSTSVVWRQYCMCCQLLVIVLRTGNDNRGVSVPMYFSFLRKRTSVLRPTYKENTALLIWNY
jgi:hypothetical protein